MLKSLAKMLNRLSSLRRDEEGFVVMVTLCLFLFLFVLCASIYAVGETVRTRIKLQNACDAAAYSAAVVQADGLSRMATINRAMSWTYVHMTNMQMDYITYRWLRLVSKRFKEDYDNAREYHKYIVTSFDPKLGWWAILEVVADAYLSRVFNAKCNYRHDKEGIGWWCGLGPNTAHNIKFNGHRSQEAPQSYESIQGMLADLSEVMDGSDAGPGGLTGKNTDDEGDVDDEENQKALGADIAAEESRIRDDYQKKIDALDKNDPNYEARKAELEDERDRHLDHSEDAENTGATEEIAKELQDKYGSISQDKAEVDAASASKDYDAQAKAINDKYDQMIEKNPRNRDMLNQQRLRELSLLAQGKSDDSDDITGSAIAVGANTEWGIQIGKWIDADKKNIQLMNAMLSAVNVNMYESMKTTAQFVMASMLKDPRMESDKALKNYSAYFYIPRGSNPYQMGDNSSEGEQAADFFSPLYNTEPCERLFLHMNTTEHTSEPLYSLFPLDGTPQNANLKGWGFDQWFVRGGLNNSPMPTTIRTEGALGIQRCYKDANINETGAGVSLLNRYVGRGNHIANLHLESTPDANTGSESSKNAVPDDKEYMGYDDKTIVGWRKKGHGHLKHSTWEPVYGWVPHMEDNIFKKMVSKLLNNVIGQMVDQYCDITASAGNASSSELFAMCPKASDTAALYADYDWAAGKWICLNRATFATMWFDYLMCKLLTGKCHGKIMFCNYGEITHKKKRLFVTFKYKHRGWGHYHFPKWFCGMKPKFQSNTLGISDTVAKWTLLDMIPPLLPENISGNRHGYMDSTIEWDKFFTPSKPLVGSGNCVLDQSVSTYHSPKKCVLDRARNDYESCACFLDGTLASWNYRGFSKLNSYGDCNEDAGEENPNKPIAGFINGHARIYGDDKEIFNDRYVGEKCEPWVLNEKFFNGLGTIVVGVALKHSNPFVQLYNFWGSDEDEVSEKSVLSAFDPPSSGVKYKGKTLGHNYMWTMSAARAGVRRLRRGGENDGPRMYQVTYDAFSDAHNLNYGSNGAHHFENGAWKDGKPTEAADPKIMAGCVCDGNATQFKQMWNLCEQDWDATLLPLRYAGRGAEVLDAARDTWRWKETAKSATDVGNENPLNPNDQSRSWHPLDPDSGHILNLKNMMPGNEHQLKLDELLKKNKVL